MLETALLLHYGAIGITAALALTGAAIGQSLISRAFTQANNFQPAANPALGRASLVAMIFAETAAILTATIITIVILTVKPAETIASGLALLGIASACGLSSLAVSICSSFPAREALWSIARQPFSAPRIMNMLILNLSIIQAPAIFGFLFSMLIMFSISSTLSIADGWRLCAAGLAIGLGSIGPAIGQGIFSRQACHTIGINYRAFQKILSFSLVGQTLIETPILFSLIMSFLILGSGTPASPLKIIALICAGATTGFCAITPSISSGRVAAAACKQLGIDPSDPGGVSRTALIAQGLTDTLAIYGLLIGIVLIYS